MSDRARFINELRELDPDEKVGDPADVRSCPLAWFYQAPMSDEHVAERGWVWGVDWQCRFIIAALSQFDSGRRMMPELDQLTAGECLEILENL